MAGLVGKASRHIVPLASCLLPTNAAILLPLTPYPTLPSIMVSAADRLGQHVDSGLFNIVVGTTADLAPIHLHLGGDGEGAGEPH